MTLVFVQYIPPTKAVVTCLVYVDTEGVHEVVLVTVGASMYTYVCCFHLRLS